MSSPVSCATQLAKQKEKKDGVRYSTWIKNGHVIGVDGDTIKSEDVLKQIQIDASHFRISEVRYDSWGMDELAEKIRAEGYVLSPSPRVLRVCQRQLTDWNFSLESNEFLSKTTLASGGALAMP